jgi:hypothetical protein
MIEFRDYDQEPLKIENIKHLFELSFKRKFNIDNWRWRFENNPVQERVYISYAFEKNKLISYYAVSPQIFNVKSENKKMALSMMTMTHPEFSGRGLFRKLAENVYKNLKEDGFNCVYGFANTNSHYGFRKYLNWQDLTAVYNLKHDSTNINNKEIIHKPTVYNSNNIIINNNISSKLNKEIYDWRFVKNPNHNYFEFITSNKSKFIYKIYNKDTLDIVYHFSSSNKFSVDLMEFLKYFSSTFKINIWINLNSEKHIIAEKLKFKPSSFNSYLGIIPLNSDEYIMDYKNWDINMMNSDIF